MILEQFLTPPDSLSSPDLVSRLVALAKLSHATTSVFIAHLAVFDARQLYLAEGCSSMFNYCVRVLHFSESAAQNRIIAARLVQRFPAVLDGLGDGSLNLTTLRLLSSHMRADNAGELLEQARHASKRDVEKLVATLAPRADVAFSIRRMPEPGRKRPLTSDTTVGLFGTLEGLGPDSSEDSSGGSNRTEAELVGRDPALPPVGPGDQPANPRDVNRPIDGSPAILTSASQPAEVHVAPISLHLALRISPLSPGRYRIQFTADESFISRLDEARDLCRHQVPDGDRATIIKLALVRYVEFLRQRRFGRPGNRRRAFSPDSVQAASTAPEVLTAPEKPAAPAAPARPRNSRPARRSRRRIPVSVRREVWERDDGRCTFRGPDGVRCNEPGFIEFHHLLPFARGGPATVENIVLRCRAHNQHEGRLDFGT